MTTIVNIKHTKCDVKCDRTSIFGNPFHIGEFTRDEACDRYIPYFKNKLTDPDFRAKVLRLKNKILGCWCQCNPPCKNLKCKSLRCHLETIIEYLNNSES